jgi:peptide/nickel transport system ATP-binding protein
MTSPLLHVSNLKTHFPTSQGPVRAVDGVSFEIAHGEIFGLVGETGCGKTMTGLSIIRLVPHPGKIVGGEILFEGEDLRIAGEEVMRNVRGSRIAMIFQDPGTSLNPVFTVGDQIVETITIHQHAPKGAAWSHTIEMLQAVQIPRPSERARDYPHMFSGGMKQRAMIAMSLACRPSLLIADEPTTALDVTVQAQILDLMKQLKREFGSSILLITHDLGVIGEICDRVAVMYAGEIVEDANVDIVFDFPRHPYTFGLLDAVPRLDKQKKMLATIPGRVPSLVNPPAGCKFHPRCKYAKGVCATTRPELRNCGLNHHVACHFAEDLELGSP